MAQKPQRFDEKILYKTHKHWIILVRTILKYILFFSIPFSIFAYFVFSYSWIWTLGVFFALTIGIIWYQIFLWGNSWLYVGNQKVTLSVRNGLFSQYAMNVRYRNIRDCAVSKGNIWSFFFKYGSIFIRSSANEGDFHAHYVPKVGKVYALINTLSRYSDEERAEIMTIEELYTYHQSQEQIHSAHSTLHSKS